MQNYLIPTAIVVSALASEPAIAQASPEAVKAATVVVDLVNPPARGQAQLEQQIKQMRSGAQVRAMISQSPGFKEAEAKNKAGFAAAFSRIGALQADTMAPIQRDMLAASRQTAIAAYARDFTVAELNAIATFFRTAPGTKFLAKQGQVNAEVAKANQAKFAPRIQAADKAISPKINAELQKLAPAAPK